jgi:hypothetical protein
LREAPGVVADVAAVLGDDADEFSTGGRDMMQAVEGAVLARLVLDDFQGAHVTGIFDLLGAIPRALVLGNDGCAVQHAHAVRGSDDGQQRCIQTDLTWPRTAPDSGAQARSAPELRGSSEPSQRRSSSWFSCVSSMMVGIHEPERPRRS